MPRKEDRIQFLKEVELEFSSGKRTARISDISRGGCYIDTIAAPPVGEPLNIIISSTSGISMIFPGKVAYLLEGFGFGVEFTDLSEEKLEFLNMLLNAVRA
ncbi:MAG TPA: PilZ domain-containing protein [Pyrinomonadaceae bacterium]|nr:PilZ domain-containing protein [Pyrinomonadaceae bacterium]